MTSDTSLELFRRTRTGDEAASQRLFLRYLERLTRLARSRLSTRLRARVDPEDVVLSAYRSFFIRSRAGEFELRRSGDLWRLLAAITLNKLRHQAARHRAEKRSIDREERLDDALARGDDARNQPDPEESAALADELEVFLKSLGTSDRRVVELRLQGASLAEIADDTNRSERTVRRTLAALHARLAKRLDTEGGRHALATIDSKVMSETNPKSASPASAPLASRVASSVVPTADPRLLLRFEDFTLRRMIGTGGMGKVYEARQHSLDRLVAVKFLRKQFLDHPLAVERFLHEARIIAEMKHPHIVHVHGIGFTPGGGCFIAMDLIRGKNLAEILKASPPTIAEIVSWMRQLAEALEHAHGKQIVHCDLKPANLILDADGRILVTDFGLAQSAIDPDQNRLSGGTPAYMAPEQIESERGPVGPHTDIYGAGAVLFTLSTGRTPFSGRRPTDVFGAILSSQKPPSPRALRPEIPHELDEICRRCLTSGIDSRFPSAKALSAALAAVPRESTVSGEPH